MLLLMGLKKLTFAAYFLVNMIRIAILDLYEGQPNQGMRCLREIINQWSEYHH
jgi:hypothetical protein